MTNKWIYPQSDKILSFHYRENTSTVEAANSKPPQAPKLAILQEEFGLVEEGVGPLSATNEGASAAGGLVSTTGAGAGAAAGGMSVPKIAMGRRTLSTWYTATGSVERTLLLTLVSVHPELMWTVPDTSVKFKVYCPPASVTMGLSWLTFLKSARL